MACQDPSGSPAIAVDELARPFGKQLDTWRGGIIEEVNFWSSWFASRAGEWPEDFQALRTIPIPSQRRNGIVDLQCQAQPSAIPEPGDALTVMCCGKEGPGQ